MCVYPLPRLELDAERAGADDETRAQECEAPLYFSPAKMASLFNAVCPPISTFGCVLALLPSSTTCAPR